MKTIMAISFVRVEEEEAPRSGPQDDAPLKRWRVFSKWYATSAPFRAYMRRLGPSFRVCGEASLMMRKTMGLAKPGALTILIIFARDDDDDI